MAEIFFLYKHGEVVFLKNAKTLADGMVVVERLAIQDHGGSFSRQYTLLNSAGQSVQAPEIALTDTLPT